MDVAMLPFLIAMKGGLELDRLIDLAEAPDNGPCLLDSN